jgi:hypothetical protein
MATLPLTIYIVRHGEKLGDPANDNDSSREISIRGSARAAALPSLFVRATTPPTELSCELAVEVSGFRGTYHQHPLTMTPPLQRLFSTPDFLFAAAGSKSSNRPIETISPLSSALHLPINPGLKEPYGDGEYEELAKYLLSNPTFAGKVILICWHHGTIPDLAKRLRAPVPQRLSKWNPTVFDRVWEINYDTDPPEFHDFPQQLLYGDTEGQPLSTEPRTLTPAGVVHSA